ncbi:47e94c99-c55b-43d0-b1f1-2644cd282749 [Thermothielavioides terrestris]|uniref:47e94c99-c55b-43d0-b1f1-2644cd282749 n=1 Tax=Thermothielavioides terrestris TaxID=2587410 RepID=A0A446BCL8_9PEZI|nr:47e94c99-c55b-43d0-b1f1-2644cd282749 [Thermothielavioides terrestris]
MCDSGEDTPFCAPANGAELRVGETVDITWDPDFIASSASPPPVQIFIQADFSITPTDPLETAGFTSPALDPNTGTFPWPILASYIPATANATTALLSIAIPLSNTPTNGTFTRIGEGTTRFPGPQVHILPAASTTSSSSSSSPQSVSANPTAASAAQSQSGPQNQTQINGTATNGQQPNALAIALPVALGVATALLMAAYALVKRHRPGWLPQALLARRGGERRGFGGGSSVGPGNRGDGGGDRGVRRLRGRAVEIKVVKTDLDGLRANAVRMVQVGGGGG